MSLVSQDLYLWRRRRSTFFLFFLRHQGLSEGKGHHPRVRRQLKASSVESKSRTVNVDSGILENIIVSLPIHVGFLPLDVHGFQVGPGQVARRRRSVSSYVGDLGEQTLRVPDGEGKEVAGRWCSGSLRRRCQQRLQGFLLQPRDSVHLLSACA